MTYTQSGRGRVKGRAELFRLINRDLAGLTENEKTVLAYCEIAALEDRVLDNQYDMAAECGWDGTGTVPGLLRSLETKGHIKVESYQRGRRVYVASLGKWTKAPKNTTPHWRLIKDRSPAVPSVPIHTLVQRVPKAVDWLQQEARRRNLMVSEVIIEMICRGIASAEYERVEHGQAA